MNLSFVIPTRNRHVRLAQTCEALGSLDRASFCKAGNVELIIADNASDPPIAVPSQLPNGIDVCVLHLGENIGAAARNAASKVAHGDWLIMLDDDSCPLDTGFLDALRDAPADVAAVAAEIMLPDGSHEAGGLPEVFTGCGVAIRKHIFLELGGYDKTFGYYAEEYDLSARMLLAGWRVVHDTRFRVMHHKVAKGRDMNDILRRLVRNNGWVVLRYAPESRRSIVLHECVQRYEMIAKKEHAMRGYRAGLRELHASFIDQPRREMPREIDERFTGLAHAEKHLRCELSQLGAQRVAIIADGKNTWAVREALMRLGVEIVPDPMDADACVIGTVSPGPMLDAVASATRETSGTTPIIAPWSPGGTRKKTEKQVISTPMQPGLPTRV